MAGVKVAKKALDSAKKALDMSKDARMQRARDQGYEPVHGGSDYLYKRNTIEDLQQLAESEGFDSIDEMFSIKARAPTGEVDDAMGLRAMTSPSSFGKSGKINYKIGAPVKRSYNTIDDMRAERLSGASSLGLDYDSFDGEITDLSHIIGESAQYSSGAPRVLIGGSSSEYGNDMGELVITDPVIRAHIDNIRSVNAAFDPAKAGSSDLMASLGAGLVPAAGLAAATLTPEQAMAAPYSASEYLNAGAYQPQPEAIPAQFPAMHKVAAALERIQTPLTPMLGNPLQGTADYLRGFGEKKSPWQGVKNAYGSVLDFL